MQTTLRVTNFSQLPANHGSGNKLESVRPHPQVTEPAAVDREVTLRPRPMLWLRKTLACAWCGFLIVSALSPGLKLDLCLAGFLVLGTFRATVISATQVRWVYRFMFLPFYTRRLQLKNQTCIVTGWEERSGLGEALLLGLWSAIAPAIEWLCPWPGGSYRLWLKNAQGQRVLIWRGRVARNFHRNHKLLCETTGLQSHRAPVV